jgi:hypothetical protein
MSDAANRASHVHRSESRPRGPGADYLPFSQDPTDVDLYRSRREGQQHRDPQRELRLAVLEKAIADLHVVAKDDNDGHAARLRREAREWFRCTVSSWEYSFEHICESLGLCAEVIRRGVLAGGGFGYRQHAQLRPLRLVGERVR